MYLSYTKTIFINLILLILHQTTIYSNVDLEKNAQDYVIATKRILIPEHPFAFNPSIIKWKDKLLMSFRILPEGFCSLLNEISSSGESRIGLVLLDENFNPISKPQLLFADEHPSNIPLRSEDARLITVNNRLYIVYSDNHDKIVTEGRFRMYVSEIDFDGELFFTYPSERLSCFEGENKKRREKNWVPFEYNNNLLLAYSLSPHLIFKPIVGTETCETIASSQGEFSWLWGELRGGTQTLLIDNQQYLGFFHSCIDLATYHSNGKKIPHYFIGAYTFSNQPPFEINQISPEPIIGKNFYHGNDYEPYWKPVQVVFPGGLIVDDSFIWLAYGRQDHEIWVAQLDKARLLESLVPVTTIDSRISTCAEYELNLRKEYEKNKS